MAVVRKVQAKVTHIESFSIDVKLYRLLSEKPLPRFKAGQFLHMAIDPYDPSENWPDSRVFSILTSPEQREYVEILVSQKGFFTSRIFEEIKLDSRVWLKLPYGIFNFDHSFEQNSVLIAGGTGISPFLSFIQYAIDNNWNPSIHLYYGVRNKQLMIGRELIQKALDHLPNFRVDYFLETLDNFEDGVMGEISKGILPVDNIIVQNEQANKPIYYLSGPPAMVRAFEKSLIDHNVDENRIKFDNWE